MATLHNAAKRDGSAALVQQDRRGAPGKVTARQWEQARAWREQDVSDAEIGRRLGVANTTVGRGLGPRDQAPAPGGGEAQAEPLFTVPGAGASPGARGRAGLAGEAERGGGPGPAAGTPPARAARPQAWPWCEGGSRPGMPGRCCCTRSSPAPLRGRC